MTSSQPSTRDQRELATLDGLRGVAAFAVCVMHFGALAPHAYLAVDLFFVLSGFVLEHAYGARLAAGWTARAFLWRRIRRLYPLYALGLAISIAAVGAALLLRRGSGWTPASFGIAALTGAIMAPVPGPGEAMLYPLDFPAWTLLAELLVNAVFAAVYRRLSQTVLIVWIVAAAIVVAWLGWRHGSLDAGSVWATAPLGLARAAFAFPMGVLLRRLPLPLPLPLPPQSQIAGLVALAASAILLCAAAPGVDGRVYDLLVALVFWPVLIARAAASEIKGLMRAAAIALGAASYGVYVTAIPLYIVVHAVMRARGLTTDTLPWPQALIFCVALFAAAILIRRVVGAGKPSRPQPG